MPERAWGFESPLAHLTSDSRRASSRNRAARCQGALVHHDPPCAPRRRAQPWAALLRADPALPAERPRSPAGFVPGRLPEGRPDRRLLHEPDAPRWADSADTREPAPGRAAPPRDAADRGAHRLD